MAEAVGVKSGRGQVRPVVGGRCGRRLPCGAAHGGSDHVDGNFATNEQLCASGRTGQQVFWYLAHDLLAALLRLDVASELRSPGLGFVRIGFGSGCEELEQRFGLGVKIVERVLVLLDADLLHEVVSRFGATSLEGGGELE